MERPTQRQRSIVVGVFDDQERAERAVEALQKAGFDDDQIGFARRRVESEGPGRGQSEDESGDARPKGGEGLAGGAIVGGVLGAAAALLIPGIGPVIAGGILVPLLGGATAAGVGAVGAAAGAAVGSLAGSLATVGLSASEAEEYEREFQSGRTIVTVRPGARYDEADAILREHGARDAASQRAPSLDETANTLTDQLPDDVPPLRRAE